MRVVGNHQNGEYHLEIKYATFPDDNGTWWCSIFDGHFQASELTVLVAPATTLPQVTPPIGIVYKLDAEAWTYSCVAHYAYPPVRLQWIRKSGPPEMTEFDAVPQKGVLSPDMTVSASSNLILTPLNHGAIFSCLATHPTFQGETYSRDIHFMIADPKLASSNGEFTFFLYLFISGYCIDHFLTPGLNQGLRWNQASAAKNLSTNLSKAMGLKVGKVAQNIIL